MSDPWHIQTCGKGGWLPWSPDIDATCNADHVMYTILCVRNPSSAQYSLFESNFPIIILYFLTLALFTFSTCCILRCVFLLVVLCVLL